MSIIDGWEFAGLVLTPERVQCDVCAKKVLTWQAGITGKQWMVGTKTVVTAYGTELHQVLHMCPKCAGPHLQAASGLLGVRNWRRVGVQT